MKRHHIGNDKMRENSALENTILEDIEHQVGHRFQHISSIDSRNAQIAGVVLPIVRRWVPILEQPDFRHAIYALFHTPFASSYVNDLMEWWQKETYELALGTLTACLALVAKPADAARLWKLCQELPRRPLHYMLLAKLATFPATECEVKEALVKALQEDSSLTVADLEFISKVNDPRIRQWFEGQVDSVNRHIRVIAQRVVARGKKLPKEVEAVVAAEPDRRQELFSTEVDVEEAGALLRNLAKEFGLKVPAAVRRLSFLASLNVDQWVRARVTSSSQDVLSLWFRLEDSDVVEVVLVKENSATPTVQ